MHQPQEARSSTPHGRPRLAYLTSVLGRSSESFIASEVLAHRRAGLGVDVFSLWPQAPTGSGDDALAQVVAAPLVAGRFSVGRWLDEYEAARALGDTGDLVFEGLDEHPRHLAQALQLGRLLCERRIAHLHVHFADVAARVARLAARFAGIPYSVTAHASDRSRDDAGPERQQWALAGARSIVGVTDFDVADLRRTHSELAGHIHRVYAGVDVERLPFALPEGRAPRIVALAQLADARAMDELMEACALLAQDGRRFECMIIGPASLEAALGWGPAARTLDGVLTFAGGMERLALHRAIRSAAAVAVPSTHGRRDAQSPALPSLLLEAMASGTPCVATDTAAIPEAVLAERTGITVPQAAPAALAAALGRLLDDTGLRLRLAVHARRLIEERFDVEVTTARWREVVLGLPADASGARRLGRSVHAGRSGCGQR
jgi:glycosyltransferase involved in cell wall biosynthesis